MGKNGVNKDGELVTPDKAPVSLHSGAPGTNPLNKPSWITASCFDSCHSDSAAWLDWCGHAGDHIQTGDCDFYFLLPSGGPSAAPAAQPSRNGIASSALEPVQQAVSPVADMNMNAARVREAVENPAAAAAAMHSTDPVQGPTDAHACAAGLDGSSPMQVVRCLTHVLSAACEIAC